MLSAHRYTTRNRNEPNDKWILRSFRDNFWRFFETPACRLPLTSAGMFITSRTRCHPSCNLSFIFRSSIPAEALSLKAKITQLSEGYCSYYLVIALMTFPPFFFQLTQDNSLPQPWKGDALPVLFPQGWSQSNLGNMGNNIGNNMYPKLPGQGGFPQGGGMGYQGAPQGGGQGLFYPNPREPSNPPPRNPVYANTIKVDVQVIVACKCYSVVSDILNKTFRMKWDFVRVCRPDHEASSCRHLRAIPQFTTSDCNLLRNLFEHIVASKFLT